MNTDKIYAEKIASEYAPKKTSKIVALKKLDRLAKRNAEIFAYTFGIISSLILGTGMSLAMGVIGGGTAVAIAIGVIVGLIGIAGVSVNYFIYKRILEIRKNKYHSELRIILTQIWRNTIQKDMYDT